MSRVAMALIFALLITPVSRAVADSPSLARAVALYEKKKYGPSLRKLKRALRKDNPTVDEEQVIYELMAFCYAMTKRRKKAIEAFTEVLVRDPNYRPAESTKPKRIHRLFDKALTQYQVDNPEPEGRDDPVADSEFDNAKTDDTAEIKEEELLEPGPEPEADPAEETAESVEESPLEPASDTPPDSVPAAEDTTEGETPPVEESYTIPPPRPEEQTMSSSAPIYEKWWFWTAVGVVAVGAGVGTAIALDSNEPDAQLSFELP